MALKPPAGHAQSPDLKHLHRNTCTETPEPPENDEGVSRKENTGLKSVREKGMQEGGKCCSRIRPGHCSLLNPLRFQ